MSISSEQFFKNFFEQIGGTETDNKKDNEDNEDKLKKYGKYILIFIVAGVIIYLLYKFVWPKINPEHGEGRGDGRGDGTPGLFSNTDEEDTKQK